MIPPARRTSPKATPPCPPPLKGGRQRRDRREASQSSGHTNGEDSRPEPRRTPTHPFRLKAHSSKLRAHHRDASAASEPTHNSRPGGSSATSPTTSSTRYGRAGSTRGRPDQTINRCGRSSPSDRGATAIPERGGPGASLGRVNTAGHADAYIGPPRGALFPDEVLREPGAADTGGGYGRRHARGG